VIEHIDYSTLNYLDVTIITLIAILALKGFVNGFIKEFFGAIGLVGGVVVASGQYALAAQYIHDKAYPLENPALLNLLGFLAIAVVIWIIAAIAGLIFAHFANKNSKMGLISRLAGLGLSGGKYFLVFSVVFLSLLKITLIRDNVAPKLDLNNSIVYPYMEQYGNEVLLLETMQVFDSKNFEKSLKVNEPISNKVEDKVEVEVEDEDEKEATTQVDDTQKDLNRLIVNEP
jgi:membrane protein required for colicin V production